MSGPACRGALGVPLRHQSHTLALQRPGQWGLHKGSTSRIVLAMFLLMLACKSPDPAPVEVEELSSFFLNHYEDEDPAALAEGAFNLEAWYDENVGSGDLGGALQDLSLEDVTGLGMPQGTVHHYAIQPLADATLQLLLSPSWSLHSLATVSTHDIFANRQVCGCLIGSV